MTIETCRAAGRNQAEVSEAAQSFRGVVRRHPVGTIERAWLGVLAKPHTKP